MPFININQIKVFYFDNELKGTPLLFIHGWLGSSIEWIYQFNYFSSKKHIIILDLPGYGKSDKPNTNYSIEFFTSVILDFLNLLGYSEAIIIGHSLGGLIAQNIAIENPKLVKKLILISTNAISQLNKNKFLLFWVYIFFKVLYVNFLKNTIKRINSKRDENREFKRLYTNAIKIPKSVVLNTFSNMTFKFRINEKLSEILQPTLIIYGTDDRIISKSMIITLDNLIPNSKISLIEKSPHRVMVDNFEMVNQLIDDFIKN
ncbi:MAG: alpha/beta fold hydrolase [Candidatus Hermodarchaeota archaeon]